MSLDPCPDAATLLRMKAEREGRKPGAYVPPDPTLRAPTPLAPAPTFPSGKRSEDYDRCFKVLSAISPQTETWHGILIDGEPYSKARPRFSKSGGVYNSKKQRANAKQLRDILQRSYREPMTKNVAIVCLFYRSSGGRIDVDNMLKQVLDSANGVCWVDDYQVTAIVGLVELDRDFPRTIIAIGTHDSSMVRDLERDRACARCGNRFTLPFINSPQHFCSKMCASHSRGEDLRVPLDCPECGESFKRITAGQKYCSDACRLIRLHKKNRKRAAAHCVDCGVSLAGNARRCRSCWRKSAKVELHITPPREP